MTIFCETANDLVPVRTALTAFAEQHGIADRMHENATDMVAEFWSICEADWSLWSQPDVSPIIEDAPVPTICLISDALANSSALLSQRDVSLEGTILVLHIQLPNSAYWWYHWFITFKI